MASDSKTENPDRKTFGVEDAKAPFVKITIGHGVKLTDTEVITLDDSDDESPVESSDRKRRRNDHPQTLLEKNQELEEKMLRLESELEKETEETRKEIESQQKKMRVREQEHELNLKINAYNEKQNEDRIRALKAELKLSRDETAKLETDLAQQLTQTDTTKALVLESERADLERRLREQNGICQQLENQLGETGNKLQEIETELEEARRSDPQSSHISSTMDNEWRCSVCSELFIKATTLSCSHSFCLQCINQWKKTKRDCPVCRKAITSEVPSLALDNCISQFVATLSPRSRENRKEVEEERNAISEPKKRRKKRRKRW